MIWYVSSFNGIPLKYCQKLTEIVAGATHKLQVAVTLYFMSDLPDSQHTLDDIEENLRKIYHPEHIKDYQASVIRRYFNGEKSDVKQHRLTQAERWFVNKHEGDGLWRNTALGNQKAADFLLSHGIIVSQNPLSPEETNEIKSILKEIEQVPGREREATVKQRVNQGLFRRRLLERSCCCKVCGMQHPKLLIASHIKSWLESDAMEKLDPDNGLLLCPNHDAAFDRHLISFQDDGTILLSPQLTQRDCQLLNLSPDMKIDLTEKNQRYLAHHRSLYLAKLEEASL